jgi:hypothetical protein
MYSRIRIAYMNLNKIKNNNLSGFALIEALTVLFIFSLITITFYQVFTLGTKYIIESKNRLGALALANEKMEIIRNLEYDSIGTVDGEVGGNIPQDEDVTENTRQFHVHTLVEYVDDPYDLLGYSDKIWFEDYKRVTITISWSGNAGSSPVTLVSRFVPHGVEKKNPNDGILSINIYSKNPDSGETSPVSGSVVHVSNSEIGLDTEKVTDGNGNVTFMGSNVRYSIQKYEVTISKSGYEAVITMPPYPDTSYNPTDIHASVVLGAPNVVNIAQNKLANLKITSLNYLNQNIANINFHIKGGRKMGTTIESNDPVYNLDENRTTGFGGEKNYNSISPGQFTITPSLGSSNYELIRTEPASPCLLLSDEPLDFKIKLADKNISSLLVNVIGNDDLPVEGAAVQIKNDALSYDDTETTPADGKVFFPASSDPLQAGTYDLKITAGGYSSSESQVIISANELKIETKNLTP